MIQLVCIKLTPTLVENGVKQNRGVGGKELLLLLRTRDRERGSHRNLFIPPELRETEKHKATDRETEEWEAAVRRDAETAEEIDATSSESAFRKEPKEKGDGRETSESLHALFDDADQDEK